MITYDYVLSVLGPTLRGDSNLQRYYKGLAELGLRKTDNELMTVPFVALVSDRTKFPSAEKAMGIGIRTWQSLSQSPSTGRFDPAYTAENVRTFTIPYLSAQEVDGLKRFLQLQYLSELTESQKQAMLAAHAHYFKRYPPKAPSYITYLPSELAKQAYKMATQPIEALKDTIEAANRLMPDLMGGMKQWALIGAAVLVAVLVVPRMIGGRR